MNDPPRIKHWLCRNYESSYEDSKKVTPSPMGIDYHTLRHKTNHCWGKQQLPKEQDNELGVVHESSPLILDKTRYKSCMVNVVHHHERSVTCLAMCESLLCSMITGTV